MNNILKINFGKRRHPSSLLGLALDGGKLEAVVLRRSNGSLLVSNRISAALALDPLTADADLVGREILNHLEAAGIRERRCVVALPLKWALVAHTQIPKIDPADVPGFLEIEAERGFPTDVATLQLATSRMVSKAGTEHVTFVGIPRNHLERLEKVLRAAKLRPLRFSLGITSLEPSENSVSDGVMAMAVEESQVALQINAAGGVAALRALEGVIDRDGDRVQHGDLIAREARITLGQLPDDLRESVKTIRIYGPRQQAERLAAEIRPRFESAGMKVELVHAYTRDSFGKMLPSDTAVSGVFSLAARHLVGRGDVFEFLPPKVSAWQRATARYAPGKLRKAAAVGIVLLVGVGGVFGYQQYQLNSLRMQWKSMEPQVKQLSGISEQINRFRPWFDTDFKCLSLLRQLTVAFPEDGSVTAKTVEIRDMKTVICTGTADSHLALNRAMRNLQTNDNLAVMPWQTRGKSPIQFSVEYHINGVRNENR